MSSTLPRNTKCIIWDGGEVLSFNPRSDITMCLFTNTICLRLSSPRGIRANGRKNASCHITVLLYQTWRNTITHFKNQIPLNTIDHIPPSSSPSTFDQQSISFFINLIASWNIKGWMRRKEPWLGLNYIKTGQQGRIATRFCTLINWFLLHNVRNCHLFRYWN